MAKPVSIKADDVFAQFLIWPPGQRNKLNTANLILDFQRTNQELLNFLDITITCVGNDRNSKMECMTSRYVGAIPTVVFGGEAGGDIFVYPGRMSGSGEQALSELTSILLLLDEDIQPEFYPSQPLKNAFALRPPLYYEAIKYLRLYQRAIPVRWRKFRTERRSYPYPKGSTDWEAYAQNLSTPQNWTRFPARDSVLTVNHPEWQELKYVFELAAAELMRPSAPQKLRTQYAHLIQELGLRTKDIPAREPHAIREHVSDPVVIKELKRQANILLTRRTTQCTAWRIDVAKVFELYVQLVLKQALQQFGWGDCLYANARFSGAGQIPPWGLQYLEPDIVINHEDVMLIADAKYKSNLFAKSNRNDPIHKETHRHDLHQLLAYCAFAPQKDKLAMLVYPYNEVYVQELSYQDPFAHTKNTVLLVGLPFEADHVAETVRKVKEEILQPYLTRYMEEQKHE